MLAFLGSHQAAAEDAYAPSAVLLFPRLRFVREIVVAVVNRCDGRVVLAAVVQGVYGNCVLLQDGEHVAFVFRFVGAETEDFVVFIAGWVEVTMTAGQARAKMEAVWEGAV